MYTNPPADVYMKYFNTLIIAILAFSLYCPYLHAQRGTDVSVRNAEQTFKTNHALLIYVDDYEYSKDIDPNSTIEDLKTTKEEVEQLAEVLVNRYTFERQNVTLLRNPNRAELLEAIQETSRIPEDENLLIYFAGHGDYDAELERGYWWPRDAKHNSIAAWISNLDIRDQIKKNKSQHTLLISDACFSGSILVRGNGSRDTPKVQPMLQLYNMPSRQAMTSGFLEVVPARSVFAQFLIQYLDENKDPFLSAFDLYAKLRAPVQVNSDPQTFPQYDPIAEAGHEGGDFIFVLRDAVESGYTLEERMEKAERALESEDYEYAFRELQYLAGLGYKKAQNELAIMYQHGKGITQDEEKAKFWFGEAAKKGDITASQNLETLEERIADRNQNSPQSTYYFFQSNGIGLRKNTSYYQNVFLFINNYSYGVSDNFAIGAGAILIPISSVESLPAWVTTKVSFPINNRDDLFVGINMIAGKEFWGNATYAAVYSSLTIGKWDRNINLNVGFHDQGQAGWADHPSFSISSRYGITSKFHLMFESFFVRDDDAAFKSGFLFLGGRSLTNRLVFDYGLIYGFAEDNDGIVLPWFSLSVPINISI